LSLLPAQSADIRAGARVHRSVEWRRFRPIADENSPDPWFSEGGLGSRRGRQASRRRKIRGGPSARRSSWSAASTRISTTSIDHSPKCISLSAVLYTTSDRSLFQAVLLSVATTCSSEGMRNTAKNSLLGPATPFLPDCAARTDNGLCSSSCMMMSLRPSFDRIDPIDQQRDDCFIPPRSVDSITAAWDHRSRHVALGASRPGPPAAADSPPAMPETRCVSKNWK